MKLILSLFCCSINLLCLAQRDSLSVAYIDPGHFGLNYYNANVAFMPGSREKAGLNIYQGMGGGIRLFNSFYISFISEWGSHYIFTEDLKIYKNELVDESSEFPRYMPVLYDTVFSSVRKVYAMQSLGLTFRIVSVKKLSIWLEPKMSIFRYSYLQTGRFYDLQNSDEVYYKITNGNVEGYTCPQLNTYSFYLGTQLLARFGLALEYHFSEHLSVHSTLNFMTSPVKLVSVKDGLPFTPSLSFGLRIR